MDKNRPPHLPRKRPVVTIEGEAASVAAEHVRAVGEADNTVTARGEAETGAQPQPEAQSRPEPELDAMATDDRAAISDAAAPAAEGLDAPEMIGKPAAAQQAPTPDAAVAPVARASRGGSITSGLVGAIVALAGGFGLQTLGYLPAPTGDGDRIAALEAQVQAMGTADSGDLEGEVAALKESLAALAAAAPAADLATRLAAAEERLATLASAAPGTIDPALLDRITALEGQAASGAGAAEGLSGIRTEMDAAFAALKAEIAALDGKLAERAGDPNLAAAVAATALRAAVDRGGPFAGELETLATFQPGSPAVAALRAFAASGVPPRTEIIAGFEDAASAMLAADAPVNPDATLMERLIDGARGLVRVRPVGDVEGDTTGARIARIGEALTRSDDATVETEFAALPAPVRAAGEAFMQRFRARAQADTLIAEAVRAAAAGSGN